MRKNAILALILAGTMTAAMTSCGPKEDIPNGTEQPSYNEAMGIDDKTEEKEEVVIEPTQEILDAELSESKVQLGNKVYTMPLTLQKLLDDGAVITNGADPISDVIGKWESKDVDLQIDGAVYTIGFSIIGDQIKIQLKDGATDYYYKNTNTNTIYAKGIRVGSTIDELKKAWGEPSQNNADEIYYYDADFTYDYGIGLDLKNQTITYISISSPQNTVTEGTSESADTVE